MRPLSPVAPRVRQTLNAVAAHFAPRGVRLFVFGSAAAHWPQAPAGADLDLGYEVAAAGPDQQAALRRELLLALAELPTIRPVDLVDFGIAAPEFRQAACAVTHDLPDVRA
ncbi:MAG: hypothetical protein HYV75_04215 [Opitutae bacterium]|nr:hypothetical protein [Opitutae bacterium]